MKQRLLMLYFRLRRRAEEFHRFYEPQYLRFLHGDTVRLAPQLQLGHDFCLHKLSPESTVDIAPGCSFRKGMTITLFKQGQLTIGPGTFFNNQCSINCLGQIQIGANNMFGEGVKLYDHNHKYSDPDVLMNQQGLDIGSITIGDNCWIGSNTVILNNVTIGDNVVIGANNLIYKSIPSNTIIKANASFTAAELSR